MVAPRRQRLQEILTVLTRVGTQTALADTWFKNPPTSARGAAATALADCVDTSPVAMGNSYSGVGGSAALCVSDAGVRASIATSNLAAGNAYTVWFVYFDRPRGVPLEEETDHDLIYTIAR
jgi:hypothetical protein